MGELIPGAIYRQSRYIYIWGGGGTKRRQVSAKYSLSVDDKMAYPSTACQQIEKGKVSKGVDKWQFGVSQSAWRGLLSLVLINHRDILDLIFPPISFPKIHYSTKNPIITTSFVLL